MATVAELITKLGFRTDTKPLENVERKLEALNAKLRVVAGAEVIRGLVHLSESFGHSALELMNTAAAAGLTTDAMQGLQFAVTQAGGNAAELGMTMTHIAREIQGAKMGASDALEVFYLLGISQAQIASFRDTEDALYGIMGALQKIQDPLKRQALMDRALGQGSRALGRFALQGEKAARESEAMGKRIGALVPRGTLDQLGKAKASMDALGMMFRAVSSTIGGMFAPVITHVVGQIERFYSANKAIILQSFEEWTIAAAGALGTFSAIVEVVGGAIIRFIGKNKELITTGLEIAAGFVAIENGLKGIASAWKAIGTAFTFGYWALAALGISIVAAGLHDLFVFLTTGETKDFWTTKLFKQAEDFFSTGMMGRLAQGAIGKVYNIAGKGLLDYRAFLPDVEGSQGLPDDIQLGSENWKRMQKLQSMSGPLIPPSFSSANSSSAQVTVNSTNTFNIPAGMTVEQTQKAATAAVRDSRVREYEHALVAQRQAFMY